MICGCLEIDVDCILLCVYWRHGLDVASLGDAGGNDVDNCCTWEHSKIDTLYLSGNSNLSLSLFQRAISDI